MVADPRKARIVRRASIARAGIVAVALVVGPWLLSAADQPSERVLPAAVSFAVFSRTLPGAVGVAFAPGGGREAVVMGKWRRGVAWSTSKVPLSIAALRAFPTVAPPLVVRAISASDNAAAEQLWSLFGAPDIAARATQAILREGGDAVTRVQSSQIRPPFTAFGQTVWRTREQALFAAQLPCLRRGEDVVALMKTLIPEQRWGLARLPGAAAKGGWGPDPDGRYLVRQFGLIPRGDGVTAVAIAAQPDSGTFADGMTLLDDLAGWLAEHRGELPTGTCLSGRTGP